MDISGCKAEENRCPPCCFLEGSSFDQCIEKIKGLCSYLLTPFWKGEELIHRSILPFLPGQNILELANRFFQFSMGLGLTIVGFPLALGGLLVTGICNQFHLRDFRYLKGELVPQKEGNKFLHLNTCMFPGGLPLSFGGVMPACFRLNQLNRLLKEIKPDLLFLSEFNRTLVPPLYEAIKKEYAHFFVDIGLNGAGLESCLFIACRTQILTPPRYFPFRVLSIGEQKQINRGFFLLQNEECWSVFTHLHPHESREARAVRQAELLEIVEEIKKLPNNKSCYLIGDLNINRFDPLGEYEYLLSLGFTDQQNEIHEGTKEVVDYFLIYQGKKESRFDVSLIGSDGVLSDHPLLVATRQSNLFD